MYFFRSKSTLDSLKTLFNVFKGKPSLGGPDERMSVLSGLDLEKKCTGFEYWCDLNRYKFSLLFSLMFFFVIKDM